MSQYALPRSDTETGTPSRGDPRGMTAFIRATAAKYGVDPEVALRVARSEGLSTFQSSVVKNGVREPSWGAFQLYTGGGLGNEFQKATGLDPSNPANEKATIDFALKHASQRGWGPWYGAKNTGIGEFEGVGGRGATTVAAADSPAAGFGENTAQATRRAEVAADSPAAGFGEGAAAPAPVAVAEAPKNDLGEGVGDALQKLAAGMASGPVAQNAARGSTPANAPLPSAPTPQGAFPTVDPKQAEMQRQQLAMAMQRLNSGKLF